MSANVEPTPRFATADPHVALLAYRYWEERGRPFGSPEVDWFRAVATLGSVEAVRGMELSSMHVGPDTLRLEQTV